MSIEKLKPSFHFEAERIEQLKKIAPEAFDDGNINWETLKEALGDFIDDENANAEHFGLFWPGKREARKIASTPSLGTLIPCIGKGINEENTNNIFIEGENLEVLKLLQKSYANRIKMIYIDPPYNTGKDFVYEDNFTESIDEYLKRTGQLDEEAKPISINSKADGRYHSKWLTLMYPRLRLARNLLKDDGVIFISIDDNEIYNLRNICNEIFGEENFLAQLIWKSGRTSSGHYTVEHEYVLAYVKSKEGFKYFDFYGDTVIGDRAIKRPSTKNPVSNIKFPSGIEFQCENKIFPDKFGSGETVEVINGVFECHNGKLKNDVELRAAWTMKDQIQSWLKGDEVIDQKGQKLEKFYFKSNGVLQYQKKKSTLHPKSIIDGITTKSGSNEILDLFNEKVFDFPKPTKLLIELLSPVISDDDAICLDFFAGSGSLGDAIYRYNNSDAVKSANFILVQIPDKLNKSDDCGKIAIKLGYETLADITCARLKKSIERLPKKSLNDNGFKYYKLQNSNYKPWKNYIGTDIKELENLFESNTSPLVDNWQPENLLSEILLIEGFPLDSKIEVIDTYKHNKITQVCSDFCEHKLLVCLDDNIDDNTIKSLELSDNDIFICLDNAISDKDKVTLQDKGLIKTI
ncbi:site-specific DNA-methyltransferase [Flavobacterium sp. 83]|uniref:site-specific DNA-methyltransferase n=1 Tax=Flavobacterium sp. 83 TaxID=1131812 RepID=UPI00068DDE3F|nr:site-specific DNA-methyltransferase [Flavobacterium sp. 83]